MIHQEAVDRNDLVNHLIGCIESNDARYSFDWACGGTMEIYDKEKEVGYVLHLARIEYDESGNAINL